MTVQSAFEEIHELFPNQTDTAIYRDLDSAQKEFCNDTKILTARGTCSNLTTNFGWNLPSDCVKVYDFRAYNSSGHPVYFGEEQLGWEVDMGKIYLYSLTSTPISTTPTSISSLYVHYYKTPTAITTIGSSFSIKEKYHKALVAKVLAEYFAKYPTMPIQGGMARDWSAVKYWTGVYEIFRLRAKRDANDMQGKSDGEGVQYPYGGKFELPMREYDSSVSLVTLTGLSSFYAKYVLITAVEGEATGTNVGQYGYTGTITCTISGNTITVSSTASDFGVYVDVDRSNNDINWTRTSATTITLTAFTGWTRTMIMAFEVI